MNIISSILKDKSLIILSVAGIVIALIAFFIPPLNYTTEGWKFLWININTVGFSKFTIWEIASMLWSFCFSFYYYSHLKKLANKIDTVTESLLLGAIIFLPLIAILTILAHSTMAHLTIELLIIFTFFYTDRELSKKLINDIATQREYQIITHLLNIPLLITFIVFYIWYLLYSDSLSSDHTVFISGFSATIFIVINSIFIVIQSGIVRELYECKQTKENCKYCKLEESKSETSESTE